MVPEPEAAARHLPLFLPLVPDIHAGPGGVHVAGEFHISAA